MRTTFQYRKRCPNNDRSEMLRLDSFWSIQHIENNTTWLLHLRSVLHLLLTLEHSYSSLCTGPLKMLHSALCSTLCISGIYCTISDVSMNIDRWEYCTTHSYHDFTLPSLPQQTDLISIIIPLLFYSSPVLLSASVHLADRHFIQCSSFGTGRWLSDIPSL